MEAFYMGENLDRYTAHSGSVERFGMSMAISDKLHDNFADRGIQMAHLLVATLTETPYVFTDGNATYSMEVSNIPAGGGPDTVVEAQEALNEAANARAQGMEKSNILNTVKTNYLIIGDTLSPRRKDGIKNNASFEEAFVETSRKLKVLIPNPEIGSDIIARAPGSIKGLLLGYWIPTYAGDTTINDMVSTKGRMVVVESSKSGIFGVISQHLSNNVMRRGGLPPRSTIVSDIKRRVVELRTKNSER
jgi:hypothetical protein